MNSGRRADELRKLHEVLSEIRSAQRDCELGTFLGNCTRNARCCVAVRPVQKCRVLLTTKSLELADDRTTLQSVGNSPQFIRSSPQLILYRQLVFVLRYRQLVFVLRYRQWVLTFLNYATAAGGFAFSGLSVSRTPSQRAMTAVARQLPSRLTDVRAISMIASTPRMTAMASIGNPN